MALLPLCHTDDLAEGACREFDVALDDSGRLVQGFLIKRQNRIYAYRNQCPHTGITLNWVENQFLDMRNEFIQCTTHGALFRVEDGFCVRGPCAGRSLSALQVIIRDQQLFLDGGEL